MLIRTTNILLSALLVAIGLAFFWSSTAQAVPQLPMLVHGDVTVGGSAGADGLRITAEIGGTNFGVSARTGSNARSSGGEYGRNSADDFQVRADDTDSGTTGGSNGDSISFEVAGVAATIRVISNPSGCGSVSFPSVGASVSTYPMCIGGIAELDLSVSSVATATPTPVPAAAGAAAVAVVVVPVAVLDLSSLGVSPTEVGPDAAVTVSFTASETGGLLPIADQSVTVAVDGTVVETLSISLDAGASKLFTTTVSATEIGSHVIVITAGSETLVGQFTVLAPTPTPTPIPAALAGSQTVALSNAVVISAEQATAATSALVTALGKNVSVTAAEITLASVGSGKLELAIAVSALRSTDTITGTLNLTVGDVTIVTEDGVGTAEKVLAAGLKITSAVTLVTRDGVLAVVFEAPRLVYEPVAPAVSLLTGGSAEVTEIGAAFDVALLNLPEGASLDIQFAKDISAVVDDVAGFFASAASRIGIGASIESNDDVAFVVTVDRSNIEQSDLGDTVVTLEVSALWVLARQANGKQIAIVKRDDAGNVFSEVASCSTATSATMRTCEVTFTGAAAGFSLFALVAVQPRASVAPTATPVPVVVTPPTATPKPAQPTGPAATPTPTPPAPGPVATALPKPVPTTVPVAVATATPKPAPTSTPVVAAATPTPIPAAAGGGGLMIAIVVVLVIAVAGAIGFFLLRSRRS